MQPSQVIPLHVSNLTIANRVPVSIQPNATVHRNTTFKRCQPAAAEHSAALFSVLSTLRLATQHNPDPIPVYIAIDIIGASTDPTSPLQKGPRAHCSIPSLTFVYVEQHRAVAAGVDYDIADPKGQFLQESPVTALDDQRHDGKGDAESYDLGVHGKINVLQEEGACDFGATLCRGVGRVGWVLASGEDVRRL